MKTTYPFIALILSLAAITPSHAQTVELFGYELASSGTPAFDSVAHYFDSVQIPRRAITVSSSKCGKSVASYIREQTFNIGTTLKIEVREQGPTVDTYSGCVTNLPYAFFRMDAVLSGTTLTVNPAAGAKIYQIVGRSPSSPLTLASLAGNLLLRCTDARTCVIKQKAISVPTP